MSPFMSSNDLYGNGDDGSYFVKHDELTDVVACPGIIFPSLQNSCYVPTEEILPHIEDEDE